MKKAARIMKVYFKMAICSLMEQMEYKINFFWSSSLELAIMISNVFFVNVIFNNVDEIGGWTEREAIMLVVMTAIFDCTLTFFCVASLFELPKHINQGTLDFILLKPINNRFYISFGKIHPPQILNLFILWFVMVYLICSSDLTIDIWQFIIFFVMFFNGVFILYNILFMIMVLSFWVIKIDVGLKLFFQLFYIGNKPQEIFPSIFQKVFTYVIPLFAVFNFPITFLNNNNLSIIDILSTFVISILLFLLSQFIFKSGLKKYSSASS